MSVRIIEQRYCDVCEVDYSDKPDWMILTAANAPAETDAQWDFCSYSCLVTWINTDEDEQENPNGEQEAENTITVSDNAPILQQHSIAPVQAPRPIMSLADAIASGTLDFSRKQ